MEYDIKGRVLLRLIRMKHKKRVTLRCQIILSFFVPCWKTWTSAWPDGNEKYEEMVPPSAAFVGS